MAVFRAAGSGYSTAVIPGDEMMQAFAYTHIDPARYMYLIRKPVWENLFHMNWHPASLKVVKLDKPVTLTVLIKPPRNMKGSSFEVVVADLPPWVKIVPGGNSKVENVAVAGKGEKQPVYPLQITLAADAAVAMADGDMDKLFSYQQKHQEALEKKIRADALKGTTKPVSDKGDGAMTLENLRKMSAQERYEFSQKNPDEYKALYGGN